MNVAVITRRESWFSQADYHDYLVKALSMVNVNCIPVPDNVANLDHFHLVWDPALGLREVPKPLKLTDHPVVTTVHFSNPFRISLWDCLPDWKCWFDFQRQRIAIITEWLRFSKKVTAVVAISKYSASQIQKVLRVSPRKIFTIYQGIDHSVYTPEGKQYYHSKPYFVHVSMNYNPLKNIKRILSAYQELPTSSRPDLILKISHYCGPSINIPGVTVIPEVWTPEQMASLYRGARALIFPSLFEGFGIPIIEAMACGCPVLTSNRTACPETAGSSGLCVNPYSIKEIADGMRRLSEDEKFRENLQESGLKRAGEFVWSKTALEYKRVFMQCVEQ